jgi:hypothetical protein
MEVHHHPKVGSHLHGKKNFKEYFLEFLMIFLAVTLGFFAENIREHYNEKTNAKEYLETYRDELLQQQSQFYTYKKVCQNKVIVCDSIKMIFFNREENKKINVLERLLVPGIKLISISFSTSSYDQIVNSGALRYINNIDLRDSMAAYKGLIETTKDYNAHIIESIVNSTFELSKLEDLHDMISADTTGSYNILNQIPDIKPFPPLSEQQRNFVVFFYESYIIQAQSDLLRLKSLYTSNQNLIKMVNAQLNK